MRYLKNHFTSSSDRNSLTLIQRQPIPHRVLIELICEMQIRPQESVAIGEVCLADDV